MRQVITKFLKNWVYSLFYAWHINCPIINKENYEMKSDRRITKINKIQPSNVTKSSQYCFTSGDDKAEKSVGVKINALEAELKKNTYFIIKGILLRLLAFYFIFYL